MAISTRAAGWLNNSKQYARSLLMLKSMLSIAACNEFMHLIVYVAAVDTAEFHTRSCMLLTVVESAGLVVRRTSVGLMDRWPQRSTIHGSG